MTQSMTSMNGAMSRRAVLAGASSAAMAGLGLALLPSAAEAAPLGPLGTAPLEAVREGGKEGGRDGSQGRDAAPVEQARVVVVAPRRRRVCWWRRGRRVCAWR